jgi:predicted transcriptional regulator
MKMAKVRLRTGSTDEFFGRLRDRAKRLDRGESLPSGITISFEDPMELLKVLSAERVRLLRSVKAGSQQVSALATGLKRDVRAVSRDVSLLEKAGLLHTSLVPNPGHGRLKIVEPVAKEYELIANI